MRRFLVALTLMVAAVPARAAHRVFSRSIMDSCQFVYRVESDVRVFPSAEMMEIFAGVPLYVRATFENILPSQPLEEGPFYTRVNVNEGLAEITFESMSTSRNVLFRHMRFDIGLFQDDGTFYTLSDPHRATIGREMGEACHTSRNSAAVFVERRVTKVP